MSTKTFQDSLDIMRRSLGRKNANDPQSSDSLMLTYLSDFAEFTMSDDVKVFENFSTLTFTIDETVDDGVYSLSDVASQGGIDFVNLSQEAFISILSPQGSSVSWNWLPIYQDPGQFFSYWGINNEDILIPGYPTQMLYYGNNLTFRTVPEQSYQVQIYGYRQNADVPAADTNLPQNYWVRYLALGAAANYARDFRYEPQQLAMIEKSYARERKLLLTRTHNQIKMSRAKPRF